MEKQMEYAVYGAFIGDLLGSHYEGPVDKFSDMKGDIYLFRDSEFTDDTKMTCAVASAILTIGDLVKNPFTKYRQIANLAGREMKCIGRKYPGRFGGGMWNWILSDSMKPYYSFGNGACMKLGPVGLWAKSRREAKSLAKAVTSLTHNHPIALYYANIVASMVYEAKSAKSMDEMIKVLREESTKGLTEAILGMDLEELHLKYKFDVTCQGSVPQALYCFLSSTSFEDCLRRCLYIGGDTDTIAACALSIAAPFYGDEQVRGFAEDLSGFLPNDLRSILERFSLRYPKRGSPRDILNRG